MVYQMKLQPAPFESIKRGIKKVEMRLNDQKRKVIKQGDFICFTHIKSGEQIFVIVKDKLHFSNFEELYNNFDKSVLGYEDNEVAHPNDMSVYYDKKEIEQNGVLAIVIELITRKTEIWDLYDKNGNVTGETHLRGFPIPDGRYHLAVHAWITDGKGKYLISKRSANKKSYPLKWECVGGSVLAGESSLQGALREIKEEVGLDLSNAKHEIVFEKRRDVIDGKRFCDWAHVYLFYYSGEVDLKNALTGEVCETKWATVNEIKQIFESGELVDTLEYFFTQIANK